MTPERKERLKRMIGAAGPMEVAAMALKHALVTGSPLAHKLASNEEFWQQQMDELLERVVPLYDSLSDDAVEAVTAFYLSPAGQSFAKLSAEAIPHLDERFTEWGTELRKRILEMQ